MKAELIDHMGDDLRVANAARVSFDKESEWEHHKEIVEVQTEYGHREGVIHHKILSERDDKLIHYLAQHDHFTPFTHCMVTLRETVPIFVARQRFKHVVGFSYNEVSRRYVDSEPEFYAPDALRLKAENKKQGSSEEILEGNYYHEYMSRVLELSTQCYRDMLKDGVCPEQARMVLPQSMMTSYYVTGSLAAFARAYNLRSKPDAQKEIQMLAAQWDEIIRPLFPVSWEALTNGA